MDKATEALPPGILTLERKPDHLTLRLRQPGLKGVTAKVITLFVESTLEQVNKRFEGGKGGGPDGIKIEAPPPPPPPVKE